MGAEGAPNSSQFTYLIQGTIRFGHITSWPLAVSLPSIERMSGKRVDLAR